MAATRTCCRDQHAPLLAAVVMEVRRHGLPGVVAAVAVVVAARPHLLARVEACQDVPRPAVAAAAAGNRRRALSVAGPARLAVQAARSVQRLRRRRRTGR